jgi:hypothetical protein
MVNGEWWMVNELTDNQSLITDNQFLITVNQLPMYFCQNCLLMLQKGQYLIDFCVVSVLL